MEGLLWLAADGVEIFVEHSENHYIDRPDFWRKAFTLYAAYDPTPAELQKYCNLKNSDTYRWFKITPEKFRSDAQQADFAPSNYRYRLSKPCSPANLFKQRLQIQNMLHMLFDGEIISENEFYAVKRLRGATRFVVNIDSLFSNQIGTEKEEGISLCFATRLLHVFKLADQATAWQVAWILTRAALSQSNHIIRRIAAHLMQPSKDNEAKTIEAIIAESIEELRLVRVR